MSLTDNKHSAISAVTAADRAETAISGGDGPTSRIIGAQGGARGSTMVYRE